MIYYRSCKPLLTLFPLAVVAVLLSSLLVSPTVAEAQPYEANWESLDSRPTPAWWTDAKFGIFIHWGPYSVPAISDKGEYSEWYWKTLVEKGRKGHQLTREFQDRVYGPNFTYPDFVPMFTCELFDADQWAKIMEASGAKYVVLTSKHHDGYTLWPSQDAEKSWGRPWSSTNSGPGRDLLGELTDAVRKTDMKMGIYYSLYEWFNPLYTADPAMYVREHMIPQFKDVVTKYAPAIIFTDGEWDHPDTLWRSPEVLAWLFNESPCKDEVVVNDRWGKETRHKHGGYYTTEYGAGLAGLRQPVGGVPRHGSLVRLQPHGEPGGLQQRTAAGVHADRHRQPRRQFPLGHRPHGRWPNPGDHAATLARNR